MKFKSITEMLENASNSMASVQRGLAIRGLKLDEENAGRFMVAANHMRGMLSGLYKKNGAKKSLSKYTKETFRGPIIQFRLTELEMNVTSKMKAIVIAEKAKLEGLGIKGSSTENHTVSNFDNSKMKLTKAFFTARDKAVSEMGAIITELEKLEKKALEKANEDAKKRSK